MPQMYVVTKVDPQDLAMAGDIVVVDMTKDLQPPIGSFIVAYGVDAYLTLRQQVWTLGEILILDETGREVGGAGRKPNKWGVEITGVDTVDEARNLIVELEAARSRG